MSTSDEAVVIWGEVLWDRFISSRPGEPATDYLGGAPANVAWHLGQAGGWPQLITSVGDDDDGRRAIKLLSEYVDTSLIQTDMQRKTGEVTVAIDNGEPRYTLHAGRAWEHIACTPHVERAISEAGVLVYGTLSQRTPEGFAAWEKAVAAASDRCTVVCDVNLRRKADGSFVENVRVVERAIEAANVIKVNEREVAVLAETLGWRDGVDALRDGGRRVVAVTRGDKGSTLYGKGAPIHVDAPRAAPGGDNVGCGDAYVALLVLGMTSGWDLADSARVASRWAAAVAEVRGATPRFTIEQITDMLGDLADEGMVS